MGWESFKKTIKHRLKNNFAHNKQDIDRCILGLKHTGRAWMC